MPLTALINAVNEELKKTFLKIPVYNEYPQGKVLRKIPAIFFELPEFEESDIDPATGEVNLKLMFETRIIISVKQKKGRIEAANMAAKTVLMLKNNNFGLGNVTTPEKIRALDEGLDPKIVNYEAWLVQWEQDIKIGENIFEKEPDFIPDKVFVGHGAQTIKDYEEIA